MVLSVIHLIRHAQAEPEPDSADPSLSAEGREQAARLASRLARRPVSLIAHGPAARATETARAVADVAGVPATMWDSLADRTPVPRPDERSSYEERRLAWFDAVPAAEADPGGTAIEDALGRLQEAASAAENPIVAVTHTFVVARMVQQVLGASDPLWMEFDVANTGITTIARADGGRWRVRSVNDTAHLDEPRG